MNYNFDRNFWFKRLALLAIAYMLYAWSWNLAFGNFAFGNTLENNSFENLKSNQESIISQNDNPPLIGEPYTKSELLEKLKTQIPYDETGPNIIGHLIIEDQSESITEATFLYIKKGLEHYKKIKPIFIILELNTPGGEVYAAQKISDALKEMDTQHSIPVVAYVNNWAISAGAMIAYSCRFIAVAKDASMGAAEPVFLGTEGHMESASEKVRSAIRSDFASRASYFDRNPLIAEAMVDKDIILVKRKGVIVKLDNEAQIETNDVLISAKGKLLTLNAEQLMSLGVADFLVLPSKLAPLSEEEITSFKWPAEKNALFQIPYFKDIPNATIDAFKPDWKMRFFSLLANPAVSSILMLGLIVGFYMEVTTPGVGLPGTIAATCLFLIIISSYSLEIANFLEVILVFSGMAVILVELFILPSFGLLGFVGIVFFLMGLFGLMNPSFGTIDYEFDTHTFNLAGESFIQHLAWFCGTLFVALFLIFLIAKYLTPQFKAFNRFVLKGNEQTGYTSFEPQENLPKISEVGVASTTLRPSGKVIIADVQYDALSIDSLIERGEEIIVVGIDGGTLLVAKVSQNSLEHNI